MNRGNVSLLITIQTIIYSIQKLIKFPQSSFFVV